MSTNILCPNCGKSGMSVFYRAKNVPVHSCVMMVDQEEAFKFPQGDIELAFCEKCKFISNVSFNHSAVDYSSTYEDQQCFSPAFNTFAQNLTNHLIKKYDIFDKEILEIGCGKGDFLALLCESGGNRGIGIDPAYVKNRVNSNTSKNLKFIRDYYSEKYARHHGDLIVCRHTLEHIHNTAEFITTLRCAIGHDLDTIVFFEVPNVTRIFRELAFWDIYYEHCSYFSPESLTNLFRSCKFEILDLSTAFDEQYLLLEARPVIKVTDKISELKEPVNEITKDVEYFSIHCNKKLDKWRDCLWRIRENGKRAVIWGSGSKCVSFMTTLKIRDEIKYVVDINPYRHGKFLPGAGKKIMPPEFLKKYKPDITFIMNPIYSDEIKQMLEELDITTEVIPIE